MQNTRTRTTALALGVALAVAASATSVAAQDEAAGPTVAEVNAGVATGTVSIDGAVLGHQSGDEYLFSDGTDVITIDLDTSDPANAEIPTLTLLNIQGTVASDEIDVSSWALLDIMVPAVIRTPQEAMETFQGWIITQNAQAAVESADPADGPADGEILTDG